MAPVFQPILKQQRVLFTIFGDLIGGLDSVEGGFGERLEKGPKRRSCWGFVSPVTGLI